MEIHAGLGAALPQSQIGRLETYSSNTNAWAAQHFALGFPGLPLYAHLFLLKDGKRKSG